MRPITWGSASLIAIFFALHAPAVAAQGTTSGKLPLPDAPKAQTPAAAPTQSQSQPATKAPAASNAPFKEPMQNFSYALGLSMGTNLKRQSVDLDLSTFEQGLKAGLGEGKVLMTDEEVRATMMQFQNDIRAKREEKIHAEAAKNKQDGDAFLEANKSKPGVMVLPSGLQYRIISEGTGPKPVATDTVQCNYRGTLINGMEFDSSQKHGGTATFGVGRVIKGWTEALQLMNVGSKWELFVPANLAYGERGAGGDIGPNETLIFEIELVSIQGKAEPGQPKPAQPKPQQ